MWQLRSFFYSCYSLTLPPTLEAYQTVTGSKSILLLILHYSHLFHIRSIIDNQRKDISTVILLERSILFYSYNSNKILTLHGRKKKKKKIPWNKNLQLFLVTFSEFSTDSYQVHQLFINCRYSNASYFTRHLQRAF